MRRARTAVGRVVHHETVAPPPPLQPGELDHLRDVTAGARAAFQATEQAFLRLETAHASGDPGFQEHADFQRRMAAFKDASDRVQDAWDRRRNGAPLGESRGAGEPERTTPYPGMT